MSQKAPNGRTSKGAGRGRPRLHRERWVKVSVVLFERQVVHLDRLMNELRKRTGKIVTRAGLIRGLIDRYIDSDAGARQLASPTAPRKH